MAVVRRIYDHFKMPMSAEAHARFAAWAANNPPEGRSTHKYDEIDDGSAIADAFGPYITRYGL